MQTGTPLYYLFLVPIVSCFLIGAAVIVIFARYNHINPDTHRIPGSPPLRPKKIYIRKLPRLSTRRLAMARAVLFTFNAFMLGGMVFTTAALLFPGQIPIHIEEPTNVLIADVMTRVIPQDSTPSPESFTNTPTATNTATITPSASPTNSSTPTASVVATLPNTDATDVLRLPTPLPLPTNTLAPVSTQVPTAIPTATVAAQPPIDEAREKQLFDFINFQRPQNSCPNLTYSQSLTNAARLMSIDQATRGQLGLATGDDFGRFLKLGGYSGAAHVIFYGEYDNRADKVMETLVNSENLRVDGNPQLPLIFDCSFTLLGVGYAPGNNGLYYWTVVLGK